MNDDELTISLSITPTWSILKDIGEKTERFMTGTGACRDIIDATVMCAAELVENAIKYGSSAPGTSNINFDLRAESGTVSICVSNGIRDDGDVRNVKSHIDSIRASGDPGALYTGRLRQLMENPRPGVSQLGLYRIAYEGEFALDCTYRDGILTVRAARSYQDQHDLI